MNQAYPTIDLLPVAASPEQEQEQAIYEVRQKIYPRAVHGWFAGWRVFFVILTQLVFYGLPWLEWNGRQAVLFDLASRKFYIFGLVFWPQDFIYLAVLLIISAMSLFLFTAVAGRLWCGYACPQTVYTEIFQWIERKIEGDQLARIRLDAMPFSLQKIAVKSAKHALWIALALWTGFTFVGYFTPIKTLAAEVRSLGLGPWETFWVLFYGAATYGNAGWMREQVCKYMCPYARFQSAMFDRDTLTITYDMKRGEPRGPRSKKVDRHAAGLGDCVDCHICVQVCPVGIDIRQGLQYECIGCGACIDGCNQVMDKMGYPKGLIRYTTENALARGYDTKAMWKRVLRPRTLVYTAMLLAIVGAAAGSLAMRNPLKVDVIRDRGSLAREAAPGVIENVYRLQLMNTDEKSRDLAIRAEGLPGLKVVGVEQPIALGAGATKLVALRLQAVLDGNAENDARTKREHNERDQQGELSPGTHKIEFIIQAVDDDKVVRHEKSSFIIPR
jgi:cytochrome c oxidase accessory protein FixG